MAGAGHEYAMSGVKVKFPAKAYPSQVAMMSKIVTSLQRSQNALLESPTGSGKTLALLCSALAWQEAEQKKCDEFNSLLERATVNQDPNLRDALLNMAGQEDYEDEDENPPDFNIPDDKGGGFIPQSTEDDDDDFVSAKAKKPKKPVEASVDYHLPKQDFSIQKNSNPGPNYLKMPKKRKCPKVYFGTRTHKQVAQIVRELKKTCYSGVRMTILASRDHTCVHPTVSKSFHKTQDCQDLLDRRKGGGCRFQANVKTKMATHHSVRAYIGSDTAWDIEELVRAGKKVKACPYYAVRELKTAAQLVICPYNYLVEPNIRSSMEISLKNQIVILDEAHNIEDSARDAASGSFKLDEVEAAMKDCEAMVECNVIPDIHRGLAEFLSRLCNWMSRSAAGASDYSDFNSTTRVMTGTSGLAEWNEMVFSPANYYDVKSWLQEALKEQAAAMEQNDDGFDEGPSRVLSKKTSDLIAGIFTALDFMHRKEASYRDDYKISVVKANERPKGGKGKSKGGWTARGDAPAFVTTVTLNFWCLNPGVCFDELLDCRSIVLTSGTLSPMLTFASELEVRFPVSLEANHVIDKSQVWVGTLGTGPTGHSLNANYQNANTYGFQDEVGRLVLQLCSTIPHGVLVFLPSYKLLNDLTDRWKATGLWTQLFSKKAIVSEPRFGDELETVMKEFYSVISATAAGVNEFGQDGAMFLAVCRGKVSEGLDFADNNARAVVCVGIPFPAVKDTLVDLKKKYNDQKRSVKPNLLPGRDWYEIQAFRALNQALGRCIRHRRDWGAILMVDDRYSRNPRYVNSLSKWVRGRVVHYNNTNLMVDSLNNFTKEMKIMDAENDVKESMEIPPAVKVNIVPAKEDPEHVQDDKTTMSSDFQSRKSAWSPPAPESRVKLTNKVNKLVNARKSSVSTKPLIESKLPELGSKDHLNTAANLHAELDNRTNLTGLGSLGLGTAAKTESKLFDNSPFDSLYGAAEMEEESPISSSKRKHSSTTASECNFDMGDEEVMWEEKVEEKNIKKTSFKKKLHKFRRSENVEPLKDSSYDNLPNLKNLCDETKDSEKAANNNCLSVKENLIESDYDNENAETGLLKMLEKRRFEKQGNVTSVPDTPEKLDDFDDADDELLNNVNLNDFMEKPVTSSKRPLFIPPSDSSKVTNNTNPVRSFPGLLKESKEDSADMFGSDDEDMFDFEIQQQVKPSLSSADEIEEPEEDLVRKVKSPKKKSAFKKNGGASLKRFKYKAKSLLAQNSDDDDDFK